VPKLSLCEAVCEAALAAERETGSLVERCGGRALGDGRVPEVAKHLHALGVVPHVSGHSATGRGGATHFRDGDSWFGDKVECEARGNFVDRCLRNRKLDGVAYLEGRAWVSDVSPCLRDICL
jgi:hypothetical protein